MGNVKTHARRIATLIAAIFMIVGAMVILAVAMFSGNDSGKPITSRNPSSTNSNVIIPPENVDTVTALAPTWNLINTARYGTDFAHDRASMTAYATRLTVTATYTWSVGKIASVTYDNMTNIARQKTGGAQVVASWTAEAALTATLR